MQAVVGATVPAVAAADVVQAAVAVVGGDEVLGQLHVVASTDADAEYRL